MLSVLSRACKSMKTGLKSMGLLAMAAVLSACVPSGGPAGNASGKVQVALLVPGGSGQASDELLARSLQNAARLAIADLGPGAQVDLRVYNTGGQPAQAAAMATQAVAEGAQIILGPVFAQEANAAGVAVAGQGVSVLAFSNNPDIAGNNVFILGPTFSNTANRLASYAVRQGKSRILIAFDRNTAGELGRAAIERGVASAGGTIVGSVGYEFSQNGVVAAAPQIVQTGRANGAQAIFTTADSAGALPLVTQLVSEAGLKPSEIKYIGLTRWDIPAATLSLPGTQGGWFAMPDPALFAQYQSRYQAAYAEAPHPISGLAYDGIAAIGALMKNAGSGPISKQALTQSAGFAGVTGVFRLRPDGLNDRGLAVAEVRAGQAVIVDPAPRSFGGTGF
jgi:ABC-type branched-subunit amino acid transport system substrate-binding protein